MSTADPSPTTPPTQGRRSRPNPAANPPAAPPTAAETAAETEPDQSEALEDRPAAPKVVTDPPAV